MLGGVGNRCSATFKVGKMAGRETKKKLPQKKKRKHGTGRAGVGGGWKWRGKVEGIVWMLKEEHTHTCTLAHVLTSTSKLHISVNLPHQKKTPNRLRSLNSGLVQPQPSPLVVETSNSSKRCTTASPLLIQKGTNQIESLCKRWPLTFKQSNQRGNRGKINK